MSIFNLPKEEYLKKSLAVQAMIEMGMDEQEAQNKALQTYDKVNQITNY